MLAVLAVLLGACSADPDSTGSSRTGESGSAASKDPAGPEPTATVFDPDEPTLPGGVRVLSRATDDMVALDGGRYGVRVSDSLLYQVDVPDRVRGCRRDLSEPGISKTPDATASSGSTRPATTPRYPWTPAMTTVPTRWDPPSPT